MNRRQRLFIQVIAHLVILAYVFQIGAFDHWHSDLPDMVGAAGQSHAMHCHGNAAGCSDTVDPQITATLEANVIPPPPEAQRQSLDIGQTVPQSAFVPAIDRPPRV